MSDDVFCPECERAHLCEQPDGFAKCPHCETDAEWCLDCQESAYERMCEDYYGGSTPTFNEQVRQVADLKRKLG